jgi:SAM-dependent methyltransferase
MRTNGIVSGAIAFCLAAALFADGVAAQQVVEPTIGQAGKDAVWVPTSAAMVEKMLDVAKVTPQDFVVDLGSGDGRTVIAAAKRGVRALGVEYNQDLVELSRHRAREAGVADKAMFAQGDMFEADISKATVLALFLLPENLARLRDKFLALPAGTRIVVNTLGIPEWEPDSRDVLVGDCASWCTALLHIVPAKVAGAWQLPYGELMIEQKFQMVSGTMSGSGAAPISDGRLLGDQISFKVAGDEYRGRVTGDRIEGTVTSGGKQRGWSATRRR